MWETVSRVYYLDARIAWARSHAQIPTARCADDNKLQILFSSRDELNRSLIASLAVDQCDPSRIIEVWRDPILPLGEPGSFDDRGLMPSSLVERDGKIYLFYIGWNVRDTVPYHNSVGLAFSEDKGRTFQKVFSGPVMDRTPTEPFFCGTSCVRIENGIWRNWYLSCTDWIVTSNGVEPRYHIKYAESQDGVTWRRHGTVAIDYASEDEGGIVRASVVLDGCLYRMWYCYRKVSGYREHPDRSYKIGYAESADGLSWKRMDTGPVLDRSLSGWDSQMLAYPEVVDTPANRYMFYNGNGFGATGFGYAVWRNP